MSNAKGVRELERYRKDFEPLSPKQSIRAYCADCMNLYQDSIRDCANPRCPLYPHQPYNKKKKVVIEINNNKEKVTITS